MDTTVGIVTALNPVIGYDKATGSRTRHTERQGHFEVIREQHVLPRSRSRIC
jgi:aspartate ammonia-lyase